MAFFAFLRCFRLAAPRLDPPRVETRGIEPRSRDGPGIRPSESFDSPLGAAGARRRGATRASYFDGGVPTGFAPVCTRVCTRWPLTGFKPGGVSGTLGPTPPRLLKNSQGPFYCPRPLAARPGMSQEPRGARERPWTRKRGSAVYAGTVRSPRGAPSVRDRCVSGTTQAGRRCPPQNPSVVTDAAANASMSSIFFRAR